MNISFLWLLAAVHIAVASWAVFTYIKSIVRDLRAGTKDTTFREWASDVMAVVWMLIAWEIMLALYIFFSLRPKPRRTK